MLPVGDHSTSESVHKIAPITKLKKNKNTRKQELKKKQEKSRNPGNNL